MTRTTKSPQQRAQEALDVAERLVKRLTEKAREHRQALKDAEHQLERATARRDYLKAHPDLTIPEPPLLTDDVAS